MKNPKLTRDRYRSFIEFDVNSNRKIKIGQEGNVLFIENNGIKYYLTDEFFTFNNNIAKLSKVITEDIILDWTKIAGTSAGQIGHANGAVLIPAQAGVVITPICATFVYKYSTSAYTGGAGDLVISNENGAALTPVIAGADLLLATGDKITTVMTLSSGDFPATAGKALSVRGTSYARTTALGTLTVKVTYIKHTI